MKVKDAVDQFRLILHDIHGNYEYDNYHCLMRLNSAAQYISTLLVQIASPMVIAEGEFTDGDNLPENFLKTCGTYPMKKTGNKMEFLDGSEKMKIRYFVSVPQIKALAEDMPFTHDLINDFVVRTAVKYALNRNEFDISQDQNLLNELQNAAAEAMA